MEKVLIYNKVTQEVLDLIEIPDKYVDKKSVFQIGFTSKDNTRTTLNLEGVIFIAQELKLDIAEIGGEIVTKENIPDTERTINNKLITIQAQMVQLEKIKEDLHC